MEMQCTKQFNYDIAAYNRWLSYRNQSCTMRDYFFSQSTLATMGEGLADNQPASCSNMATQKIYKEFKSKTIFIYQKIEFIYEQNCKSSTV